MSSTNLDVHAIGDQCFADHAEGSDPSRNIHPETEIARLRNELDRVRADLHDALSFARLAPWGVDLGSGRVLISDEGLELLGRGRDEVPSTLDGIFSLFHPDDRARAMSRLRELVAGGQSLDHTFRLMRGNGSIVHAWFRGNPIVDAEGRVVSIRGIWQDVTARVEIEDSLRESEENHRHAVELSAQVLWTAAPDGRILDIGPRWSEMTGLPVDDALGEGWASVIHPEDLEAVTAARATSLATGEPTDCDYRLRLAGGSYRWMRARAAARRDANGGIVRWYGSLEDIHARKVAERRLRSSEAFSRSVIESSGDSIMVLDHAGIVRFVNGAGAKAAGYDIGELFGRDWLELSPDEFRTEAEEALAGARVGEGRSFSASAATASGGTTWWDVALNPIRGETGDVRGLLVVSRDVTEKRAALIEADAAHDKLVDVLESTADAVLCIDRSWQVTYMNGIATDLLGHRLKVGCDMFETYPDYVGTEVHRAYLAAMGGQPSRLADLHLPNLGIHADLNLRPTKDGISVFLRDVSEAHEARRAIIRLAHHDPLTGLANRARYNAFLNEHSRSGTFGILLLDLDRFKEVNDTFGHSVGDALLVQATTRFSTVVGERGLLARLGGDEFAIVVPQAEPSECLALADALVASLREPIHVERHILRIGLTIGISVEAAGSDTDAGFKRADLALYKAKADGGDRICLYDVELNRRVGDRVALKHDLGLAIERNQLSIAYQPMRDLRDGGTCAREALLRWNHPIRGSISPAEFIPLAEEAGLIVEIGDWVLRQACFEAAGMDDGAVVSVNLSPIQFEGSGLEFRVAGALAASGLPPSRLELEITESVLLKDSEDNLRTLHAFKAMGVRVALDDFGTGFSSLSYLRNFRFDKIKIDRSFVADIGTGNHSEAIVAAVISLGRTLGMMITAEGVETECQLRWLDEHGCHQAQGYLIGRPGPIGGEKAPLRSRLNVHDH